MKYVSGIISEVQQNDVEEKTGSGENQQTRSVSYHHFIVKNTSFTYKHGKPLHLQNGHDIKVAYRSFLRNKSVIAFYNRTTDKLIGVHAFFMWCLFMFCTFGIPGLAYFHDQTNKGSVGNFLEVLGKIHPNLEIYAPYALVGTYTLLVALFLYHAIRHTQIRSNLLK